jgi:ATP-dependent phosphoenolpyruvate carboxykinase
VFSACFGAPFMVWHPSKYAEMLAQKMRQHNCTAWLVNTVCPFSFSVWCKDSLTRCRVGLAALTAKAPEST